VIPLALFVGLIFSVQRFLFDDSLTDLLRQVFYLLSLQINYQIPDHASSWELGYTWTLVVEFHFYILATLILYLSESRIHRIGTSLRLILISFWLRDTIASGIPEASLTRLDLWTMTQFPFFGTGLILSQIVPTHGFRFLTHFEHLKRFILIFLVIGGGFSFQVSNFLDIAIYDTLTRTGIWAIVVLVCLTLNTQSSMTGIAGSFFEWIGKNAFSIYATHVASLLILSRFVVYSQKFPSIEQAFFLQLAIVSVLFVFFKRIADTFNRISNFKILAHRRQRRVGI
jgi:peptidoglycan/LPS O-acetylase OafA/YrhL